MKELWRLVLATVVLLGLAGAAGGLVLAQSGDDVPVPGKDRLGNFIGRLADNLGITQEELEDAIDETQLELVDEAVEEGRIEEEKADSIRERIESGEGFGFGFRFPGGFANHLGSLGAGAEELADFLGTTVDELRDARANDQSLAQIAEANGVSRDDLIAFLVGQTEEKLAAKVEDGTIDQARADEIQARFEENVDDLVDQTGRFPRFRHHRGGSSPEETTPEADGVVF